MGDIERVFSIFSRLEGWLGALFQHKAAMHPARFANPVELATLTTGRMDAASLLLGKGRFNQVLKVLPAPGRPELGNMLVVARTRGGKGLLAGSQLYTWPHSVVVNDIKGELFAATAGYRQTLGPVYVLDPRGLGHRFDPLSGRTSEDKLLSSATQLLARADEGEGRIFTERAIVMLTQLFLAARREGQVPLPYVRRMVRTGLIQTARHLNALDPVLAVQFLDVAFEEANFADRFLLSAWSTLSTRMRLLLTETVIRSLAGSSFRPSDLMRGQKPVTVYLRWPEEDLPALAPLVRLLWGSIIDELISTYDRHFGQDCHPVLLLIDEAGRSAVPALADAATTVAGRGISLWIAVQSLSQLEAVYGRARAQVIRDNVESQLYYRPANLDTAKFLEERLSSRSAFARSQTFREGQEAASGLLEQAVPLMSAWELMQMKNEEVIGIYGDLPPFKAWRIDWRDFSELSKRRRLPPPALEELPAIADTPLAAAKDTSAEFVDPDPLVWG